MQMATPMSFLRGTSPYLRWGEQPLTATMWRNPNLAQMSVHPLLDIHPSLLTPCSDVSVICLVETTPIYWEIGVTSINTYRYNFETPQFHQSSLCKITKSTISQLLWRACDPRLFGKRVLSRGGMQMKVVSPRGQKSTCPSFPCTNLPSRLILNAVDVSHFPPSMIPSIRLPSIQSMVKKVQIEKPRSRIRLASLRGRAPNKPF